MKPEILTAAYPIMRSLAATMAEKIKAKQPPQWFSCEDLTLRLKEIGIKEPTRSLAVRLLKPLQSACAQHGLPDLSSIIVLKPRPRQDVGELIKPPEGWWDPYVERGECQPGDVSFWFTRFREARDYEWPAEPFFSNK